MAQTAIAKWLADHHRSVMWLAEQMQVRYGSAHAWAKGMATPNLTHAQQLMKLTGLTLEQLTK